MDTESEIETASELLQQQKKNKYNLWPPTNENLGDCRTLGALKLAMEEDQQRLNRSIVHQKELENDDSQREREDSTSSDTPTSEEDRLVTVQEMLRQQLIDEGISEQHRLRKDKWNREMHNELYLLNDIKREQVIDHKLKNPIPILHCNTVKKSANDEAATMGDLKKLVAQQMPRAKLESLTTKPLPLWNCSAVPRKPSLVDALRRLFSQNIGPSLAVVVDGKQFYCHSMLLGIVSGFFTNRNFSQVLYLPSAKIPPRSFVNIYRWMLEPINSITLSQLIELLRAAKFLAIAQLSRQCWRLAHEMLKMSGRVLTMYITSKRVCSNIEKIITPYVANVWLPFVSSREYVCLEFKNVQRLLQLDSLAVNTEMEIMYSAIIWLQTNWPARKCFAIQLMRVVRFDIMPFVFLITFGQRKDGSPAMSYLQDSVIVRKMIFDGLAELKRNIAHSTLGSCQRHWIYDPACPYHHSQQCNAVRFASFDDFTNYLRMLQDAGYPHGVQVKRIMDEGIVCC